MQEDYTYQVARIRALETGLLTDADIEQLITSSSAGSAVSFLEEKGWGTSETAGKAEDMLSVEEDRIWDTCRDLHIDFGCFDVLTLPKTFHNVKAAIKSVVSGESAGRAFYDDAAISEEEALKAVREKEFDSLPESCAKQAEEAYNALSRTGDGQLCDIIMDRACMEAMIAAGREAGKRGDKVLSDYAEDTVAIADIKIAYRAALTGKGRDFLDRALAECEGLNLEQLKKAASSGEEAVREYLGSTDYRDGAEALAESVSAFEKWADDRIMDTLRDEKYEVFTIGPVIAYVLARQNEIKTARMIIACKENGLSEDDIRARKRDMYV